MPQPNRILRVSATLALFIALFPALGRAGTWVAFQNTYTRGTGAPVTVTNTFTLLNPATQYTLKAFNGGLQNSSTELVSTSFVLLNGVQVIGPSDFSQNVAEANVTIFPGLTNTVSVQVRGQPGGVLTVQVIGVDNDPPSITASVSPSPNAAGWNNSPVTVTFTCSDKTSGVASCPSPVTVSTEGANQVVSGTATDLAGNTATTSVTINLDMTPPTIIGTINPPPDAGGYNSGPVTVTFTCADALSGVASCSPPVSVTSEGPTPETGMAVDVAGNTATTSITVNISLSYFKIRSWQTGPYGNPKSPSGKCLDYGPVSPSGNGATVFLNECAVANPIRVVEVSICVQDPNNGPPICKPRTGSGNIALSHEVMLFAGNQVIGVANPPPPASGPSTSTTTASVTEYALQLQYPWDSPRGAATFTPAQQIWRLDGDSIIFEGSYVDPATQTVIEGPCLNTGVDANGNVISPAQLCPPPPPQLVIQVQNAGGANGSPLVVSIRNLADNEFWDFAPEIGSRPYPTSGFVPVSTSYQLWNAICTPRVVESALSLITPYYLDQSGNIQPLNSTTPCGPVAGWGSVIVVTDNDPNECTSTSVPGVGACINLSPYPPITLSSGATLRGSRRGTNFGPQLFYFFSASKGNPLYHCEYCMIETLGDYTRVTGLRMRGQSRLTDTSEPPTEGVEVGWPGQSPGAPVFPPSTLTDYIATIDHNDMSDWGEAAVRVNFTTPYGLVSPIDPLNLDCSFTDTATGSTPYYCKPTIMDDSATLANVRVAHNFLHHNEKDNVGYGVEVGRALIEGNTFVWNRHAISSGGEPHNEYRASHNLVLSNAPTYCDTRVGPFYCYQNQDFDVHGTAIPPSTDAYGAAGGFYADIVGNTFLGTNRQNYWLRGYPIVYSDFDGNVSLRNDNDAIHFVHCSPGSLGCQNDLHANDFPINIYNNKFANSTPPSTDPTAQLGVGDFDGDGDDDLFLATGAGWYFSPGGKTEWRYLNSAHDTIDQLLFGDFDNDGRTDVVGMRNGQLYVSWGGISAFEPLNNTVPPNCTMATMTVGDFNGVGRQTDIFCADPTNMTWWISYGGNTQFAMVNGSGFSRSALRFGHFAICGTGTETDVFSVQSTGWFVSCGATTLWRPVGGSLTNPVDGLVVADFDGDGVADVGMACNSGGVVGIGASAGWQISSGGTQGWSTCNAFASATNSANCAALNVGLNIGPCFSLANGAVGRFSGGHGADILLWNYYNSQGAATLWDFPGGAGTPYQLSAPDVDMH